MLLQEEDKYTDGDTKNFDLINLWILYMNLWIFKNEELVRTFLWGNNS